MNFWQRAVKNVSRKKTKSLLLLITFFVIGNFVIVGLGISSAADTAKVLTRKKMRAVVTYGVDYDKVYEYTSSLEDPQEEEEFWKHHYPKVSIGDVQEILKDERVKTANALTTIPAYIGGNLQPVKLNNKVSENEKNSDSEVCIDDGSGNVICNTLESPNISLKGNHFPDMIEFSDNSFTILEGRFYRADEIEKRSKVVIIPKALAELNSLSLGDTFSYQLAGSGELKENGPLAGLKEEDIRIDAEIIGIYDMKAKATPDNPGYDWMGPSENPENTVLTPASTMEDALFLIASKRFENLSKTGLGSEYYGDEENAPKREDFNSLGDVILLLNDPLQVDSFVKKYSDKLGEFKTIRANNDEFNRLSKPLDTLELYANFIVWLVVLNAVIIITLVTALTLKTREFEIGVLLAIGASKVKVILQFFAELAIVAILGFTLSIVSGSLMANQVGKTVLDYQITSDNIQEGKGKDPLYDFYNDDYTTNISLEDIVAEYNVNVSSLIIAEIYVVGLGIVLISTLIPSMMIMRFNPKKILMSQG